MKILPILATILLLAATGCQQTTVIPDEPEPWRKPTASRIAWTKILGDAVRLRTQVDYAGRVEVQTEWRTDERRLLVMLSEPRAKVQFVGYTFVPWQSFSTSPGKLVTVTDHAVVFGPRKGDPSKELVARAQRIVLETVDQKRNEDTQTIGTPPKLPTGLSGSVQYKKRSYLVFAVDRLPGAVPEAELGTMTPGNMLWLIPADGKPDLWVAPAPMKRRKKFLPGEQHLDARVNLKAAGETMDKGLRVIFKRRMAEALGSKDKSEFARMKIFRDALPNVKKVIFAYPGHGGPAHAAGMSAYEEAADRLGRFLALDAKLRRAAITAQPVLDLIKPDLRNPNDFPDQPQGGLDSLAALLKALKTEKLAAIRRPGTWTKGRVELGADLRQYMPSQADLRVAAVGEAIRRTIEGADPAKVRAILAKAKIDQVHADYYQFDFRKVAVAGTGMFWYASGPIPMRVRLVND